MEPHFAPDLRSAGAAPCRRRNPSRSRRSLCAAAALVAAAAAASAAPPVVAPGPAAGKLAFERDGSVWVASLDGSGAVRLAEGVDPAISPDGRSVAYTKDTSGPKGVRRHIAIVDVATRASRGLASVPSDNSFGPVWSPDGSGLLVYVLADKVWNLGLVKADDSAFRLVVTGGPRVFPCWSAAWASDGKSIFCQDLANIARIALDGKPLWSASAAQLFPGGGLNSGSGISPSPDGGKLLVEVDMDEPVFVNSWDGPPPAVFLVDVAGRTAMRLTEKGTLAWQPEWLDTAAFLCVVQRQGETEPSLARVPLAGGAPTLLTRNARNPTVSRPAAAPAASR